LKKSGSGLLDKKPSSTRSYGTGSQTAEVRSDTNSKLNKSAIKIEESLEVRKTTFTKEDIVIVAEKI
jgi:hypothetical protein